MSWNEGEEWGIESINKSVKSVGEYFAMSSNRPTRHVSPK